jgi:hypothetical protein
LQPAQIISMFLRPHIYACSASLSQTGTHIILFKSSF